MKVGRSYVFEERIKYANILKEKGNKACEEGLYESATALYEESLHHSEFDESQLLFELTDEHAKIVYDTRYNNLFYIFWKSYLYLYLYIFRDTVLLNLAKVALKQNQYHLIIKYSSQTIHKHSSTNRIANGN